MKKLDRAVENGAMLNAYPDSIGGTLADAVRFLEEPQVQGAFRSFYVLPSLYHSDLDRGFSVIDYGLNEKLAHREDLQRIQELGIRLKLDFILNHLSVQSPQFQDILAKGDSSDYRDFFIDWNKFWAGHGTMTENGWIQPDSDLIKDMFFRKPGLPILMVHFPDGREVPYWNTFYQEIRYHAPSAALLQEEGISAVEAAELADLVKPQIEAGRKPAELELGSLEGCREKLQELLERTRTYLGQMDLNIHSELVKKYYEKTMETLEAYGASIVRLDAFAYAPKAPGSRNFLNEPDTWDLLSEIRVMADRCGVQLLPEIHATYQEKIYEKIASKGYMTYDFFLPGLIIDAMETASGDKLASWAREQKDKDIRTVNMLGCHDGIPLLDLRGLVSDEEIQHLIDVIVGRGGYVKNLHGQKNMYYQVNATYYSALGEDDRKMLLARALQMFMPGKPQIWYLDLFAGKNDHEAVKRAGEGGHKEINRTNLSREQVQAALQTSVVSDQLKLIRFRSECPAFGFDSDLKIEQPSAGRIVFTWSHEGISAELQADLSDFSFSVYSESADEGKTLVYQQR